MTRFSLVPIDAGGADRCERLALYVPQALIELHRGPDSAQCPKCAADLITGLGAGADLSELAIRCVCRQWSVLPRGSQYARDQAGTEYVPHTLFRYFDKEAYYDDFLAGKVWVTTIDACRRSEDADRVDRDEASLRFIQSKPLWDAGDPAQRAMMKRLKISAPPGARILLHGNESTHRHPDEYMLCLSRSLSARLVTQFSPNAKRAVKIVRPTELFEAIGEALHEKDNLFHFECAPVLYERKPIVDLGPLPSYAPWMMKPRSYAHEEEVRVVWRPTASRRMLTPGFVEVRDMPRFVQPVALG